MATLFISFYSFQMKWLTLFLFLFMVTTNLNAETCQKDNRLQFLNLYQDLYQEYKKIDPEYKESIKEALWIDGDPKVNKALFIAHGYMGSPREMLFLTEPFVKAGYSVIGFLLPGHGGSFKMANQFHHSRWQQVFKKSIELVTSCFSEVKAIGFSTGGLLIQDYISTQVVSPNLKSIHLVSPFFIQRFGGFLDKILGPLFDGTSVDKAYFLTRFRDLKVMTIDRDYYNQDIPVYAGLQVKALGLLNYDRKMSTKSKIPVQLFLSEGDWTVDVEATKEVINRSFDNVQLTWYPGSEPHHLMVPSVSSKAQDIQKIIFSSLLFY